MTDSNKDRIPCPVCAHLNRPGTLVCTNCGSLMGNNPQARQATRDLRDSSSGAPGGAETGKLADASKLELDQVEAARGAEYRDGVTVYLEVEGAPTPIVLSPGLLEKEIRVGRRDPITELATEVDLDNYAGYRMGVSRKHAIIQVADAMLTVSDLGSSNGTYLNGKRLPSRQPHVLLDGDSLRLGQMVMRVRFEESS